MLPSSTTYAFWLSLLRISIGLFWLAHGVPKFTEAATFLPPDGFITKMVSDGIAHTTGPYHDFLANTVAPNIQAFAQATRIGEVLTGGALVLGLFTRLGGLGGMFLAANYMLAKGTFGSVDGWSSLDGAAFVMSALNLIVPTGRFLGLDALLLRRTKKSKYDYGVPVVDANFVDEPKMTGPRAPTS